VFAAGAVFGVRHAPYALVFRLLVRPRLGSPKELEDAAPPRFAQGVGLFFAVVGTVGYGFGVTWLGLIATAMALGAAFLNAAFGFCLGCEMYLLIKRFTPQIRSTGGPPAAGAE
jgi:zinc transporter ZupT